MRRRIMVLAVGGVLVLGAACVPPGGSPTTTTASTASTTTTVDPNECAIERATITTALMAYRATSGHWPSSLDDLVSVGFLAGPPVVDWVYVVVDDAYVLDGPC